MDEVDNDENETATPTAAEILQRAAEIVDDLDTDEQFKELDEALVDRPRDLDDELTSMAHDLRALARVLRKGPEAQP